MPLMDVPLVECICWDRDRIGKDYMGEFDIAVEEIFANGKLNQEVCYAAMTPSPVFMLTHLSRNGIHSSLVAEKARKAVKCLVKF